MSYLLSSLLPPLAKPVITCLPDYSHCLLTSLSTYPLSLPIHSLYSSQNYLKMSVGSRLSMNDFPSHFGDFMLFFFPYPFSLLTSLLLSPFLPPSSYIFLSLSNQSWPLQSYLLAPSVLKIQHHFKTLTCTLLLLEPSCSHSLPSHFHLTLGFSLNVTSECVLHSKWESPLVWLPQVFSPVISQNNVVFLSTTFIPTLTEFESWMHHLLVCMTLE